VTKERFLVTGANGCIGAWVVAQLVSENAEVVTFGIGDDDFRIRYLVSGERYALITKLQGDVGDLSEVQNAMHAHDITHVIHLAGLQTPACAADPALGARINVIGTINVFTAVKDSPASVHPLVYASSVAAHGTGGHSVAAQPGAINPTSHYGVFKAANEASAKVFADQDGTASVGLRPAIVYGVGRDRGMTAAVTKAIVAAVRQEAFSIEFSGKCQLQYAPDVAASFIAAARSSSEGASVYDLGGPTVDVSDVIDAISAVDPVAATRLSATGPELPFPSRLSGEPLEAAIGPRYVTPLNDGVAETIDRFRVLIGGNELRT
jgi:nucleoside-diphosphate-sugar epimerase